MFVRMAYDRAFLSIQTVVGISFLPTNPSLHIVTLDATLYWINISYAW